MQVKNGNVFLPDFHFKKGDVAFENGVITEKAGGEVIDAEGCFVVPGFVDIHTHGAVGCDFCEGVMEHDEKIARYEASVGVTSYFGTSMAMTEPVLSNAFATAKKFIDEPRAKAATMRGINMEGPYINKSKKGAQAEENIVNPQVDQFNRLYATSGNNIHFVDLAPELPGAREFIRQEHTKTVISFAHTETDYDTAIAGFDEGATHVTHLFNAMPTFSHRAPGLVGAAFDRAEAVELICDGIHIHPSVVRAVFAMFGADRICLISDSMMACGMAEGVYELGGQTVYVKNQRATLENGTLAGSAVPLSECVRRAVTFGIKPEDALRAATATPAREARVSEKVGSLEIGKVADIVILNPDFTVKQVILRGELL